MCSIAGIITTGFDVSQMRTQINQMSESLKRRGPDAKGEYIKKDAALIHRRLCVIDPEGGAQPMSTLYNGEKFTLVYNGELYNADELREELKAKGYHFSTHSDTEVVLKCYCEYKEKSVDKFNGIFAFAVWEEFAKRLFLCRDRIGVKPLFYHLFKDGIVFGSEIKALLKSGLLSPVVDEEGLYEIFFLGPARTPGTGVFKGVKELLPGEYAVYEKGKLHKTKYYELRAKEFEDSEEETVEKVRYLLTDAIERQLVSDVPLCFFLSGGLDSSIICQTASNFYKRNKKDPITTYSVEYEDNERYFQKSLFQPNADRDYIRLMTESAGSSHREVILSNEDVFRALIPSVSARDLPGYVDIDSSLLLFCREIKKDFTVALSGECADELFGGYPWYHNENILYEECFPWSREQDIRRQVVKNGILRRGEEYVREKYLDTVNATDKLKTDTKRDGRMREMFRLNFYWFMQCLLERKDRCSMYSGLEVRVPFCDYRLVDYAYNMPWHIKALGGREKGVVRKAFEGILPDEIIYRKKSPYPKTHNPVYLKLCEDRIKKILSDKSRKITTLINEAGIRDIIAYPDTISSPWYGQLMRAPQILAYLIQLDFWLETYCPVIEIS
ncbi:MAG: asparagine synthase (glutamine-hydrolyzing) [Ruminococcus sp.]|nr:asparagine synthase (glutamine-hydrolyzing) [Ruminococcus sp.]